MVVLYSFWWLIFPVMWFAMRLCRTLIRDMRRRDAMDVARAYAAHGKAPPAEISKILSQQMA